MKLKLFLPLLINIFFVACQTSSSPKNEQVYELAKKEYQNVSISDLWWASYTTLQSLGYEITSESLDDNYAYLRTAPKNYFSNNIRSEKSENVLNNTFAWDLTITKKNDRLEVIAFPRVYRNNSKISQYFEFRPNILIPRYTKLWSYIDNSINKKLDRINGKSSNL